MAQSKQETAARSTLKQRREQVLERLAALGLRRGPHRIDRTGRLWEGETSPGFKLRLLLGDLGPIFSAFGRYLATRVDLLMAADCLELKAIPDHLPPLPYADVRQLVKREIGCEAEEAFLSFEAEPFQLSLLHQSHHARLLQNGMPVVVKLVRTELTSQFLCDLELLELLEMVIEGPARDAIYQSAVADFTVTLRQQIDLTSEAKALETLRRDTEDSENLRVPAVLHDLSTTSLLTVERLPGLPLNESSKRVDRQGVARLLCSAWLRQALMGHIFPVEPCPSSIAVISDRQIAFTGGVFSSLPGDSQSNLWNYLIASAGDSPDQACSCLLREVRGRAIAGADEELRHRFRQVVPFRDSGWYTNEDTNYLIEHLVVHWQAAINCGYVPQLHLPSFCRGLFAITRLAQQLSTDTDPLLEGLQEARLLESVARMREMFSLQHLGDHADKYTGLMMAMPQKLDQMLMLVSEGNARLKLHVPETASHRRGKNSSAIMTAMLLLVTAVAFVLPRLTSSFIGSDWAGRVNAVAFIACAALLLSAAGRTR
jgi:hypothetical protein